MDVEFRYITSAILRSRRANQARAATTRAHDDGRSAAHESPTRGAHLIRYPRKSAGIRESPSGTRPPQTASVRTPHFPSASTRTRDVAKHLALWHPPRDIDGQHIANAVDASWDGAILRRGTGSISMHAKADYLWLARVSGMEMALAGRPPMTPSNETCFVPSRGLSHNVPVATLGALLQTLESVRWTAKAEEGSRSPMCSQRGRRWVRSASLPRPGQRSRQNDRSIDSAQLTHALLSKLEASSS